MDDSSRPIHKALLLLCLVAPGLDARELDWDKVVNNGDLAPGGATGATFRSYNQPAINDAGIVVFRARSRAGNSQQVDGVYRRSVAPAGPIVKLLTRGDAVPAPNNTLYNGVPAGYLEFPSTPRIDATSDLIATRGQHQPVWTYLLGDTETRVGTSGIYAFTNAGTITGASLLGSAVEADQVTLSFPWYSVPGALLGTRFDQFPGSPAIAGGGSSSTRATTPIRRMALGARASTSGTWSAPRRFPSRD